MSEKRFKEIYPDIIRSNYCFTDNGEPIGDKEVVDLLNELTKENQFLKKQLNIYRDASKVDARENKELLEDIDELYEENRHLRKLADIGQTEPDAIINMLNLQQTTIKNLKEENKQLKKQREELFIRERDTKNELRELKDEHLAWKRVDL